MKEISLTQGKIAIVDDDDYNELIKHKWYACKNYQMYYAMRKGVSVNGKQTTINMHQHIMGRINGCVTDHIDGNGLNNQKNNLRFVTIRQNAQNLKHIHKTSKYPGVSWDKERNKWRAMININGILKNLGRFISEIDAFTAYCKAVNNIGERVVLNEIR